MLKLLYNYILWKIRFFSLVINKKEKSALKVLKKQGIVVIENFYSEKNCNELRENLSQKINNKDKHFHVWKSQDGSDSRLFGVDRIDYSFEAFYQNKFILNVISSYEKSNKFDGFTLGSSLEYAENNLGSGGGWHRDRLDSHQTKAMLYLSDVGEKEGPFQYLYGSHKPRNKIWDHLFFKINIDETRYSDTQVNRLIHKRYKTKIYAAKKGTLIIFDSSGLHRGTPIKSKNKRYSLTNYFWFNQKIPDHIRSLLQKRA